MSFTLRATEDPGRVSVTCDRCRLVLSRSCTRVSASRVQQRHTRECFPPR